MLRITIELWPFGEESLKKHLGTICIANDGTGTSERGNYKARFSNNGCPTSTWRTGIVTEFPRKSKNAYDLLLRALVAVVGDRNKRFVNELSENEQANEGTVRGPAAQVRTTGKREGCCNDSRSVPSRGKRKRDESVVQG